MSALRGTQLIDEEKISMLCILFVASLKVPDAKGNIRKSSKEVIAMIKAESHAFNEYYKHQMDDEALHQHTADYIVAMLEEKETVSKIKMRFNGKPWRVFDKHLKRDLQELDMEGVVFEIPPRDAMGVPTLSGKGWVAMPFETDCYSEQFIKDRLVASFGLA